MTTLDGSPLTTIRRGEPFVIRVEGIAADEDPIVSVGTVMVPNDAWDGSRLQVRVPLRVHSGYVQVSDRGSSGTTIPLADPAPGTGQFHLGALKDGQALTSCGIEAPWEVSGRVDTMGLLALRFDTSKVEPPADQAVLTLKQCIQEHARVNIVDYLPRPDAEPGR